jgi:quercetin dioxygenase-like cupin family protein
MKSFESQKKRCLPLYRLGIRKMLALALLAVFAQSVPTVASSQVPGPTESKGMSGRALALIELKGEIEGMENRQLRSREVTLEPGGRIAAHSHAGRPTLEYVLRGRVIEIRNGVEIPHGPGEMVVATHDVTHWWENRGTETVVLIPVDIFKP